MACLGFDERLGRRQGNAGISPVGAFGRRKMLMIIGAPVSSAGLRAGQVAIRRITARHLFSACPPVGLAMA